MQALVVDDATLARTMLVKVLEELGFEKIWEAPTGERSIDLYKTHKPELVLMDINLPGMNGITALKKIMEMDPQARVVVCSAMGEKKIIQEALAAGAKHFIVKPIDAEKVKDIIKVTIA